mgnify:CR=1 FL=1
MAKLSKMFKVGMGALGEILENPFIADVGDNVLISDKTIDGGQLGTIVGTFDENKGVRIKLNNSEDVINVSREDVMKVTNDKETNMKIEDFTRQNNPSFFSEE